MSPFFSWNNWFGNMSFKSGINNFSGRSNIYWISVFQVLCFTYIISVLLTAPLGWLPLTEMPQRWGIQDLENHVTCLVTHQTSSRGRRWTLEMIHPFSLFAFKHSLVDFLSYPKKVSVACCRNFYLEILIGKIIQRAHILFPQFPPMRTLYKTIAQYQDQNTDINTIHWLYS